MCISHIYVYLRLLTQLIQYAVSCTGFFAAQTYALFDRPTIILFIVSALGVATPVISLVSSSQCFHFLSTIHGIHGSDLYPATRQSGLKQLRSTSVRTSLENGVAHSLLSRAGGMISTSPHHLSLRLYEVLC